MNSKFALLSITLLFLFGITQTVDAQRKHKHSKKHNNMCEVKGKITMGGNPITLIGNTAKVGDTALDFSVTGKDMSEVKLSDFKGKTVIISVFPSVDTEVCATQTRTFNSKAVQLSDDIVILTISKDLPFALKRFCAAEGIDNVHTLSDYKSNDFGLKYGFLIKELQLLSRGTVVVDKLGKIAYVEYVSEVKDEPNYDAVIEVVSEIK